MLKKTKDDQLKELQYKTEQHDGEIMLESLKIYSESYKKKFKSLNKKKVFMIVSEILIAGVGLIVRSGLTISELAPGGVLCAGSISFLSSISTLITNEYISNLKIRYAKLGDWINVIAFLYEKTLNSSMIDNKIDEEEALVFEKICLHYLDKRKEIKKNTQFKVEDIFGGKINEDNISQDQIFKLKYL